MYNTSVVAQVDLSLKANKTRFEFDLHCLIVQQTGFEVDPPHLPPCNCTKMTDHKIYTLQLSHKQRMFVQIFILRVTLLNDRYAKVPVVTRLW
jgi:hypothetical protein